MGLIQLIVDLVRYPFDIDKENNKFSQFMKFLFIEYPAFLFEKLNLWRVIVFPILLIYEIFKNKNTK
ncbi:MAG: hypothetical protein V3575_00895 [Candidatus Absconditabacteria bacterium]